MNHISPRRYSSLFIIIFALLAVGAFARGAEAAEGHDYHPHHAALFLGGTSSSGGKHGATIGVEYEYRFHQKFGVTGILDYAGGEIDTTIVAAGLLYHAVADLRLLVAPGADFHDGKEEFVVRVGAVYDFHVGDWSISPTLHIDLLEAKENVVYGLGFGRGF